MFEKYQELKTLKENLCQLWLEISMERKSLKWTMPQLKKVIKSLKCNKSRDSSGLIFELFKENVAGDDLIKSLLILVNKVKSECEIPDFLSEVQITSIYKCKGSKMSLTNERGIFNTNKVRNLVDRLI